MMLLGLGGIGREGGREGGRERNRGFKGKRDRGDGFAAWMSMFLPAWFFSPSFFYFFGWGEV